MLVNKEKQKLLPVDQLRSILDYDPLTGLFRWRWDSAKKPNVNSRDTKRIAGTINAYGRRVIKIKGRLYYCSRLAWLYIHGRWPDQEIDHINGNRSDDRIANLRDCSREENQHNTGLCSRNTSGYKGIYWSKQQSAWIATITRRGTKQHLGSFDNADDAASAYAAAIHAVDGEF